MDWNCPCHDPQKNQTAVDALKGYGGLVRKIMGVILTQSMRYHF